MSSARDKNDLNGVKKEIRKRKEWKKERKKVRHIMIGRRSRLQRICVANANFENFEKL